MVGEKLEERLRNHPLRNELVTHPFFDEVKRSPLTREKVAIFLGQWWHPLHYFPTFLSRLVSVTDDVAVKAAVSKILYQELGEGDPARAHEVIYVDTMREIGFAAGDVSGAAPAPETAALVGDYAAASLDVHRGLGFLYGTEVADLAMVSGIGVAVRRVTGADRLPWVDIHVEQEPDHVEKANETLEVELGEEAEQRILEGAEQMWRLWIAFFDNLQRSMFAPHTSGAAV